MLGAIMLFFSLCFDGATGAYCDLLHVRLGLEFSMLGDEFRRV
jgi:hypothetical protein